MGWVHRVCAAFLWLAAAPAGAAELDWQAPRVCPDAAELRFRIERALGMPLSHAAALRFDVRAEASGQGYAARIGIAAEPGTARRERALAAADCTRLADMVAVAVALALGAGSDTEPAGAAGVDTSAESAGAGAGGSSALKGRPGESKRASSEPIAVAGADQLESGAEAPSPQALWPALSLWLVGDTGSLPRPGLGAAVGAQLESSHFQLRALATLLLPQRQTLAMPTNPAPGADLSLVTGALLACAAPFDASATLSSYGCAGWELGRLSGAAAGVLMPREGAALWSAPRADVGLSWTLSHTRLRLDALLTLAMPLARDDFVLRELGSVHRPPNVVGRVALGMNWALK